MKKLLLAAVMVGTFSLPAAAETISLTAFVDGIQVATANSADGTLDVSNQAFGSVFNLNSLTHQRSVVLGVSRYLFNQHAGRKPECWRDAPVGHQRHGQRTCRHWHHTGRPLGVQRDRTDGWLERARANVHQRKPAV